jgi:hypothetical protein
VNAGKEAARRLGAPLLWLPPRLWRRDIRAQLEKAQRRASARLIDLGDVEYAVSLYRDAVKLCSRHGWRPAVGVETHGGAVPNSYDFRAQATWATVQSVTKQAEVFRGDAEQRSHGRCWHTRLTLSWSSGVVPPERPTLRGVKARQDDDFDMRWRF